MLRLLCVLPLFCVVQPNYGNNAAVSCGNFMRDWYPGVNPLSSVAPYALNISDENGDFSRLPGYGTNTVQTGSYLSHDVGSSLFVHAVF